jgi:hypothetical protein
LRGAVKANGRILFRESARSYPYFRRSGSAPDHNQCYAGITRNPQAHARVLLTQSVITFVVRAFSVLS